MDQSKIILRIHAADNVGIALEVLRPGDDIAVGDDIIRVLEPVQYGHKVSLRHISSGEDVTKYGVPIGEATADIAAGRHVHQHNLKSKHLEQYSADDRV